MSLKVIDPQFFKNCHYSGEFGHSLIRNCGEINNETRDTSVRTIVRSDSRHLALAREFKQRSSRSKIERRRIY